MQKRRARFARLQRVDHGGQRVDLDLHLFGQIFGLGAGGGDADRHAFADETDLVLCQRILVRGVVGGQGRFGANRAHVRQVRRGEHPLFMAFRLADRAYASMRDGAADKGGLPLPGQLDVTDEPGLPAQQSPVFLAFDACANSGGQYLFPPAPALRSVAP